MIPMKGYFAQAVNSAAKPFQILFSLCHFSFTFSETSIREHFSPLPPGRSRSSLALRKLSNTKSVRMLDSFGPFDFVTKPKKVSYLIGWVHRSQSKFESSLYQALG